MRRPLALFSLFVVLIVCAAARNKGQAPDPFIDLDRKNLTAEGVIRSKERKEDTLWITLGNVTLYDGPEDYRDGRSISGAILAGIPVPDNEDILCPVGAAVRAEGKVYCFRRATNHGEFDALSYYRSVGIAFRMPGCRITASDGRRSAAADALYRLRRALSGILDRIFTEPDSGTMKAVLLGDKGDLDRERKELYQSQSLSHILVVSGLHVSFVGMGIYRLIRKKSGEALSCALSGAAVVFFGALTGFAVPAARAVIMFAVYLLSKLAGRTYDSLTALGIAGAMIAAANPGALLGSGFYYSFGCVLAVTSLYPAMEGRLMKAAAVPAALLPVYLRTYYTFPLASAAVNLLAIPLSGVLMLTGFLSVAAGAVYAPLGAAVGKVPHYILRFYDRLCLIAGSIPGSTASPGAGSLPVCALYISLLIVYLLLHRKMTYITKVMMIAGAMMLFSRRAVPGLEIHFIDVGQGDGILIRTGESAILIDGGSSDREDTGTRQILPLLRYYGVDRIDFWIITHGDADHMNGTLALLEDEGCGISFGGILIPDIARDCPAYTGLIEEASEAAGRRKIPVTGITSGGCIRNGGLSLFCLHPEKEGYYEDPNDSSAVLLLRYGDFAALLPGDLEEGEGSRELVAEMRGSVTPVTLLKCAHHGSRNGTYEELLRLFPAETAVISCGMSNAYGHPHEEALMLLRSEGTSIAETRFLGEITVRTDGSHTDIRGFNEERQPGIW